MSNDQTISARENELRQDVDQTLAQVLWHPDLHKRVVKEELGFLSLAFKPRYGRDAAKQIIDRATERAAIRSYTVWELHRKPDIILKAWLPPGTSSTDLGLILQAEARRQSDVPVELTFEVFDVAQVVSHHLWPRPVTETDREFALESGGDLLTDGRASEEDLLRAEKLLARRLVAPIEPSPEGIKFFIWLTRTDQLTTEKGLGAYENQLLSVMASAPNIFATSIYAGSVGGRVDYLVSGRIKPIHYESIASHLQPRLAMVGDPYCATNTDTCLSTLYVPIDRVESLLEPLEAGALGVTPPINLDLDIDVILASEEGDFLEFKGSAFAPIAASDAQGVTPEEVRNRSRKVRDAITKSCAGFLNTGGGQLVIGVLESARVELGAAVTYDPSATQVGKYIVVGRDRYAEGAGELDWDAFERRLRTQIANTISPSPEPWLSVHRLIFGELELAVVSITEPDTWFWAKLGGDEDVFFARYGNTTKPLKGQALLNHIRSRPRSG